jgi:hypothetical protein
LGANAVKAVQQTAGSAFGCKVPTRADLRIRPIVHGLADLRVVDTAQILGLLRSHF